MSSRGEDPPPAVHLSHETSLDRKPTETAMRLVIQPTSLQQSTRPMSTDQAAVQNTLKTGLLVSIVYSVAHVLGLKLRYSTCMAKGVAALP